MISFVKKSLAIAVVTAGLLPTTLASANGETVAEANGLTGMEILEKVQELSHDRASSLSEFIILQIDEGQSKISYGSIRSHPQLGLEWTRTSGENGNVTYQLRDTHTLTLTEYQEGAASATVRQLGVKRELLDIVGQGAIVTNEGEEIISGHKSYHISIRPADTRQPFGSDLWLDMESGFPMKIVSQMGSKQIVNLTTKVELNPDWSDSDFIIPLPEGTETLSVADNP